MIAYKRSLNKQSILIEQRDISDLRFGSDYNENTRNIFSTGIKVADNGNQYAQGMIAYVEYPQIRNSGRVNADAVFF